MTVCGRKHATIVVAAVAATGGPALEHRQTCDGCRPRCERWCVGTEGALPRRSRHVGPPPRAVPCRRTLEHQPLLWASIRIPPFHPQVHHAPHKCEKYLPSGPTRPSTSQLCSVESTASGAIHSGPDPGMSMVRRVGTDRKTRLHLARRTASMDEHAAVWNRMQCRKFVIPIPRCRCVGLLRRAAAPRSASAAAAVANAASYFHRVVSRPAVQCL